MYIIGASGHARVIIDTLESLGIQIEGIYDKDVSISTCLDYPVNSMEDFLPGQDKVLIIAIGNNGWRKRLVLEYDQKVRWGTILHPAAIVSKYADIGQGTAIMAGAVIQANAKIGNHSIINTKASVDHDCTVGDFSLIAPGVTLCGGAKVGSGCLIGAGATLIPGVDVGDNCYIGAGSTVLRNVSAGEKVFGIVK
ncbi:MAG TPA: acetyltransferase [Anditalea sp.]|nr:acetyltransferase [Anditalea sp.]